MNRAGLAAAGAVLASCAPQATPQPAAVPAEATKAAIAAPTVITKGTKLRVALFASQVGEGFTAEAAGFKKKFPEMDVEFVPVSGVDWEEYIGKIITQIAAGNPVDCCLIATEGTQVFAGQNIGVPFDDYVKRDQEELKEFFADVHPALVESMMYEGNLYQLPTQFNAPNIYYRSDQLEEAGLSRPSETWTKDDFYEIVKKLTKKDSSGKTTQFGFGWTNRLWGSWTPWMFVNNSNLLSEELAPGGEWLWDTFYAGVDAAKGRKGGWRWLKPQANAEANVEALEFMVEMVKEGYTPAIELGKGESLEGFFTSGSLSMVPAGGFWVDGVNASGLTKEQFDVQFWPKWKSQRHQFGGAGYAILSGAQDKDAAWEWVKYDVSKPAMEAFYQTNTTTPTRRSMMNDARYGASGPKHWQVFYDTLDKYPDTAPIPAPKQANPMTNLLTKYTSLVMSLEKTPKQGLDEMQVDLEKLFAQG